MCFHIIIMYTIPVYRLYQILSETVLLIGQIIGPYHIKVISVYQYHDNLCSTVLLLTLGIYKLVETQS